MTGRTTKTINVVMDADTVDRVDRACAALCRAWEGVKINRSDFIRRAVSEYLDLAEDEVKDLAEVAAVEAGEAPPERPTA